ncbi:hypothetical protein [Roseibium sp. MMSF_3544]|uniref:hypothetical protein n=1 Tax=unclassified Roseibium TaxID=2629323 RepID=UPI00273EE71F|nr:hypothetical protein [Roseibium sp. MMSF_3544]
MRTQKKLVSSLLAAVFVSGAFVGSAHAIDLGGVFGDASGDEPVFTSRQISSSGNTVRINTNNNAAAYADFPDQAYGDLNGSEPVPVRKLQADNARVLSGR